MEYTQEQRQVFKFFDGERDVYCDPLEIYRKLTHVMGGDPVVAINVMHAGQQPGADDAALLAGWNAAEALVAAAREVFGLRPLDPANGQGTTWAQALAVVNQFFGFLDEKKNPAAC